MSSKTTAYYEETADNYDTLHSDDGEGEHLRALEIGWPLIQATSPRSILDVGCGTGRTLKWVASKSPSTTLIGIDPSRRLLDLAQAQVPGAKLGIGNGERLDFPDASVDIVAASGIMHHVDHPSLVISELFRVARKAVLISDHNNFAFGSPIAQRIRMMLDCTGLLGVATFVKQGFRKQGYSPEDGWWYPYSLVNNFAQIASLSDQLYVCPTRLPTPGFSGNMLFAQSHLAIVAIRSSQH